MWPAVPAKLNNAKYERDSFKSNISPETPHTIDTDNTECKLAQMKNIDIVILSNVGWKRKIKKNSRQVIQAPRI